MDEQQKNVLKEYAERLLAHEDRFTRWVGEIMAQCNEAILATDGKGDMPEVAVKLLKVGVAVEIGGRLGVSDKELRRMFARFASALGFEPPAELRHLLKDEP